ncbi:hypothetical protein HMI54_001259 [Coelomomyces lativittatus]|nr:hypothetical protein HMI54_001259 [Coelomomyces lativittatus]
MVKTKKLFLSPSLFRSISESHLSTLKNELQPPSLILLEQWKPEVNLDPQGRIRSDIPISTDIANISLTMERLSNSFGWFA